MNPQQQARSFCVRLGFSLLIAIVVSCLSHAQDLGISSMHSNGTLTWTNAPGTNSFSVEWAPAINGPWHRDWHTLDGVVTTLTESTIPIPMFFRVAEGFSQSSMRGIWIFSDESLTNANYVDIDETGTVRDLSINYAGVQAARCNVDSQGFFSLEIYRSWVMNALGQTNHGRMLGPDETLLLTDPLPPEFFTGALPLDRPAQQLHGWRVNEPDRCAGTWEGTLNSSTNLVRMVVDAEGQILEVTGLTNTFYHGRLFALSNGATAGALRFVGPHRLREIVLAGGLADDRIHGWAFQSGILQPSQRWYGDFALTNISPASP